VKDETDHRLPEDARASLAVLAAHLMACTAQIAHLEKRIHAQHRWLARRGIETYVIQPSSVPVDRRARRAKSDGIDAEMLLRTLLAWLRGEPRFALWFTSPVAHLCRFWWTH
jgi:transposase